MNVGTGPILVIDGDETRTAALRALLLGQRCSVHSVTSAAEALARLDERPFDAVVTRLSMPDMPCAALISTILASWPETSVVVVAADASVPEAVEAVKAGATDFLLEPIDREQLSFVLGKAMTATSRAIEPAPRCDAALLGDSLLMQDVLALLGRAAAGTATVLVRGESGTGKELAARALHGLSPRRAEAFVKIDCTSLPEALLESELFGYEKGAFTGATARKLGRIELAQGGTLFLDEIGELTAPLQAKLLRLLQDREFERLGGTKTLRVDVRVVAATHRDLETMVERGQFRQDLYYRLNVIAVWLPPLRARRDRSCCRSIQAGRGSNAATRKPEEDATTTRSKR